MLRDLFTAEEWRTLRALSTPAKIQTFLNGLVHHHSETCWAPRRVLQEGRAHCIEDAMLAALALRVHGHRPLILDLTAHDKDWDHVIAVFQQHGHWGAISKTNHAVLRYRDPVYRTIRELVMSYFNEYMFQRDGKKTLRSYSRPVNLSRFDARGWMTAKDSLWFVAEYLCRAPHVKILSRAQLAALRPADKIEIEAGRLKEWR